MEPLIDPALIQYCETHTHARSPLLRELEHYTRAHFSDAEMLVGPVEGALLALLVRLTLARRVL
ncbi:MAG: methyltransferase, partial [Acidiferrobacteraceae bacterium]